MILRPSAGHRLGVRICNCGQNMHFKICGMFRATPECNTYKDQSAELHFETYLDQVARPIKLNCSENYTRHKYLRWLDNPNPTSKNSATLLVSQQLQKYPMRD